MKSIVDLLREYYVGQIISGKKIVEIDLDYITDSDTGDTGQMYFFIFEDRTKSTIDCE